MPVKIGVGHRKGGTGKTTSAVMLALALARKYPTDTINLVDADATNDSASAWRRIAHEAGTWPANVIVHRWDHTGKERLAEFVSRVVPEGAHLVIDTGPHAQDALADSMRSTNVFVVPLRPSKMEVVSIYPTLEIAARVYNERPFVLTTVLTMVIGGTRLRSEVIDYMHEQQVPRALTEIKASVSYTEAFGQVPANLGSFTALLLELIDMTTKTEGDK